MKVSIIIPALNEAKHIQATLLSVRRQAGDFEIIVVDGGSIDKTAEIARRYAAVISSKRGRAVQMNAGARHAIGDALLFLHADSVIHPGALDAVRQALRDSRTVGGTFTLRFDADKILLRLYAFFTHFKFRYFHYGDQGIFVRRSIFEQLGGYREIPIMEDVDLLRQMRRQGRVALIDLPVTTSARRFLRHGLAAQQVLNVALVISYLVGVKPETLAGWYQSGIRKILPRRVRRDSIALADPPTREGQKRP